MKHHITKKSFKMELKCAENVLFLRFRRVRSMTAGGEGWFEVIVPKIG